MAFAVPRSTSTASSVDRERSLILSQLLADQPWIVKNKCDLDPPPKCLSDLRNLIRDAFRNLNNQDADFKEKISEGMEGVRQ